MDGEVFYMANCCPGAISEHFKKLFLRFKSTCRGSNKAFGRKRLAVEFASVLFDLGMGTAKILIQAFLQFRNLKYVYGIELSIGRYKFVNNLEY